MLNIYPSTKKLQAAIMRLTFLAFGVWVIARVSETESLNLFILAGIALLAAFETYRSVVEIFRFLKRKPTLRISNEGITYNCYDNSAFIPWKAIKKFEDITIEKSGARQHLMYYNFKDRFLKIAHTGKGVTSNIPKSNTKKEFLINSDDLKPSVATLIDELAEFRKNYT